MFKTEFLIPDPLPKLTPPAAFPIYLIAAAHALFDGNSGQTPSNHARFLSFLQSIYLTH